MVLLAVSLLIFYFLHSLLAAAWVKLWAAKHLKLERWYRLTYSMISLVMLAWVVLLLARLPNHPLFLVPVAVKALAVIVLLAGICLSLAAVLLSGAAGFLGVEEEKGTFLITKGLYGRMRHPIYTGIILAAVGWLFLTPSLAVVLTILITFAYLPVGIVLEEKKLIMKHGVEYAHYRSQVPALWPAFGNRAIHRS